MSLAQMGAGSRLNIPVSPASPQALQPGMYWELACLGIPQQSHLVGLTLGFKARHELELFLNRIHFLALIWVSVT